MKQTIKNMIQLVIVFSLLISCEDNTLQESPTNHKNENKDYLVNEDEAKEIASYILNGEDRKGNLSEKHLEVSSLKDSNNEPSLYIVQKPSETNPSFTIISGDKRLEPVLAYGNNEFHINDIPEQLNSWIKGYTNKIKYLRDNETIGEKELENFKKKASKDNLEKRTSKSNMQYVPQLTYTKWGQRCVYNDFAPTKEELGCEASNYLPCDRAYTGCVATCLSQVVFFYKSMDNYNYNNLRYGYQLEDSGTETGDEVARLMREVGDIMEMEYTCTNGSLAYSSKMQQANSRQRFGFDEQIKSKSFNNMSLDDIYNELESENLFVISSYDGNNGAGHLWIIDGFTRYFGDDQSSSDDDTVYLHFNVGWNGSSNGWYLYNDFNVGNYNFEHYPRLYYNFRSNNSVSR